MDAAWAMVGIAAVGVIGQWSIGMRKKGARDERQRAHEARLNKHSQEIDTVKAVQATHGERIAKVEARCSAFGHIVGGD